MNKEDKPKLKQNDSQPLLTGQAISKSRLYQKDTNLKKNVNHVRNPITIYIRDLQTHVCQKSWCQHLPPWFVMIDISCIILAIFWKFLSRTMQSLWGSLDNTATEILPFRKEEQSLEQLWVRSFAGDSATQLSKRIKFKGSCALR